MTRVRKGPLVLLAVLSGVLLPLALPSELIGGLWKALGMQPTESMYWGSAALGFVCIAPAFYAVSLAPSFGFASILGLLFGGISTALANYWLSFFQGYTIWTMGGTVIGCMGFNALLFPFLRGFARVRTRYRPFLLAAAWALYEYLKSVGFLGYPWGLVAYPVGDLLPLYQFVDTTGVWGLSFLMALINAIVAECALAVHGFAPHSGLRPERRLFARQAVFAALLLACALGYGVYRLRLPIPFQRKASLQLIQQNMDPWNEGQENRESLRVNLALTMQGVEGRETPPDLSVWSESAISSVLVDAANRFLPMKNELQPGIRRAGIPVLFGGAVVVSFEKQMAMNAAILVSKEGEILDTYGKIHPVPFAENIPFFEYPTVQRFFRNVVGIWLPWVQGSRYTIFSVPLRAGGSMSFGVPICFEDAFSDLCRQFIVRGADVLVNITNDSWSKTWSSEIQHFGVARFRAVENRRVLVRSTNGGLSVVVGPWGEILDRLPLFERMQRTVEVPIYEETDLTPYSRFGDWFPKALIVLLLAVLLIEPSRRPPLLFGSRPRTSRAAEGQLY